MTTWSENLELLLASACVEHANKLALVGDTGEQYSYEDLEQHSAQLEQELRSLGVEPDEPVLVNVGNRPLDIAAWRAVWRVGGVVVPVHVSAPAAVVQDLCERVESRYIVRGSVGYAWPQSLASEPGECVARLRSAPPPRRELLKSAAFIVFTSGSTGKPKGVVLGQREFSGKLAAIAEHIHLRAGQRTLLPLQLTFSFGQWVALLTLIQAGTLHLVSKFDANKSLARILHDRIDNVAVVPTMMRAWLARGDVAPTWAALRESGRPRLLIAGGEPLSADLGRAFRARLPEMGIADVFGLTETNTSDLILPADRYDALAGTVGFPTRGVRVRLHGAESSGGVAELQIQSDFCMRGYLDDEAGTCAGFDGPWLRTGDLARLREGAVELVGRSKDMIVRGGTKVSPLEVEAVLASHPAVRAALVAGVPDEILGERIHALVVLGPGATISAELLRPWLALHLEKYKVPEVIEFVEALPLGRTGKADRTALRDRARQAAASIPKTATAKTGTGRSAPGEAGASPQPSGPLAYTELEASLECIGTANASGLMREYGVALPCLRPKENLVLLVWYRELFVTLARLVSGWISTASQFRLKMDLGRQAWLMVEAVAVLDSRLTEMPAHRLDSAAQRRLRALRQQLAKARNEAEFIVGVYSVVLSRILEAIERHLTTCDALADWPTRDRLEGVRSIILGQLAWSEKVTNEYVRHADAEELARWHKHVEAAFSVAGGVNGVPQGSLTPHPFPAADVLDACAEPSRLEQGYNVTTAFMMAEPRPTLGALTDILFHNWAELIVPEGLGYMVYDVDDMPFEFYRDFIRQIWDECRHTEMGRRELERFGVDVPALPMNRLTRPPSYTEMLCVIGFTGEACSFPRKFDSVRAFYERNCYSAGLVTEYDILDERNHVHNIRKWLPELHRAEKIDTPLEAVIARVQNDALARWSQLRGLDQKNTARASQTAGKFGAFCREIDFALDYGRLFADAVDVA